MESPVRRNTTNNSLPLTPGKNIEALFEPEDYVPAASKEVNGIRRRLQHLNITRELEEPIDINTPPGSPNPIIIEDSPPPTPRPSTALSGSTRINKGITILEEVSVIPANADDPYVYVVIKDSNNPDDFETVAVPMENIKKAKRRNTRFTTKGGTHVKVKLLAIGQIKVTNKKR